MTRSGRALLRASATLAAIAAVACGGGAPPPATPRPEPAVGDAGAAEPEAAIAAPAEAPESARPAKTTSYEEALSTPEALDVHDDHAHLTDAQLNGPMRGAIAGCKVPANAKVSIRTAVQNGRAIGVTVEVRFTRSPKATRPPSRATLRAEDRTRTKVTACVQRNVRALTWPPSRRRDSFTTEF